MPKSINEMTRAELREWLGRALLGQTYLPFVTQGEAPHLGILRIYNDEKTFGSTRNDLKDECRALIHQFCEGGRGENSYLEELISLSSKFGDSNSAFELAKLAKEFPQSPHIQPQIRHAILSALVDMRPSQTSDFWKEIFQQSQEYSGLVLSGVLATNPLEAIKLLPQFPDKERLGHAATVKIELAWDYLKKETKEQFINNIEPILGQCGPHFALPISILVESTLKPALASNAEVVAAETEPKNEHLRAALNASWGGFWDRNDAIPKSFTSKLCIFHEEKEAEVER